MISLLLFYSNERNKPYEAKVLLILYLYIMLLLYLLRSTSALFVARNRQYLRNK